MPKSKGFTLVELLIAIAVIGVISAIGVSTYGGVREKAQDSVRKSDLQGIAAALELYYAKHGEYPIDATPCPKQSNVLYIHPGNEEFLRFITGTLPKDPKLNTEYCYETDEEGNNFKLIAILDNNIPYELTSENYIAQATATPPPNTPPPSNPPVILPPSTPPQLPQAERYPKHQPAQNTYGQQLPIAVLIPHALTRFIIKKRMMDKMVISA